MLELIDVYVDKANGLFSKKSDKATARLTYCEYEGSCAARQQGQCLELTYYCSCPAGKTIVQTGYTRRARKFHEWCQDKERLGKDITEKLTGLNEADAFTLCGDHYYFPFSFFNLGSNGYPQQPELFSGLKTRYVHKDVVTVEWVEYLFSFSPLTIFDSVPISDYHSKELPKFLAAIRKNFPLIWSQLPQRIVDFCEKKLPADIDNGQEVDVKDIPLRTYIECEWNGIKAELSVNYLQRTGRYQHIEFTQVIHGCVAKCKVDLSDGVIVTIWDKDTILKMNKG